MENCMKGDKKDYTKYIFCIILHVLLHKRTNSVTNRHWSSVNKSYVTTFRFILQVEILFL